MEEKDIVAKIREAAGRSGKPLEVACARSFLEHGEHQAIPSPWDVHLSSYFEDGMLDKVRELDVLARRTWSEKLNDATINCTLEVVASCKGFPADRYPVAFSVSNHAFPEHKDPFLLGDIASPGKCTTLGQDAVRHMLAHVRRVDPGCLSVPRVIGMGIYKDSNDANQRWTGDGDKLLWEGLDSTLRATLYWHTRKRTVVFSTREYLVRLLLPVLVTSRPWYDIPIDDGKVGGPVQCHWGYFSNLYPVRGEDNPPDPMFCLMLSRDKLDAFQEVLLSLCLWLREKAEKAFRHPS